MLVNREEFDNYKLEIEDAMKKLDANFMSIIDLLATKNIIDDADIILLKTIIRPRRLAKMDQTIQELKDEKDRRTDKPNGSV